MPSIRYRLLARPEIHVSRPDSAFNHGACQVDPAWLAHEYLYVDINTVYSSVFASLFTRSFAVRACTAFSVMAHNSWPLGQQYQWHVELASQGACCPTNSQPLLGTKPNFNCACLRMWGKLCVSGWCADRECDPDLCKPCHWSICSQRPPGSMDCHNMKLRLRQHKRVGMGLSRVAGWGAFAQVS